MSAAGEHVDHPDLPYGKTAPLKSAKIPHQRGRMTGYINHIAYIAAVECPYRFAIQSRTRRIKKHRGIFRRTCQDLRQQQSCIAYLKVKVFRPEITIIEPGRFSGSGIFFHSGNIFYSGGGSNCTEQTAPGVCINKIIAFILTQCIRYQFGQRFKTMFVDLKEPVRGNHEISVEHLFAQQTHSLARVVAEADRRICLGNIEYHYFAGYSGGAKAIMPTPS